MSDTRNSYGMTGEEWAEYLAREEEYNRQHRQAHDAYNRMLEEEERKNGPTLASLKHLRPDLYW